MLWSNDVQDHIEANRDYHMVNLAWFSGLVRGTATVKTAGFSTERETRIYDTGAGDRTFTGLGSLKPFETVTFEPGNDAYYYQISLSRAVSEVRDAFEVGDMNSATVELHIAFHDAETLALIDIIPWWDGAMPEISMTRAAPGGEDLIIANIPNSSRFLSLKATMRKGNARYKAATGDDGRAFADVAREISENMIWG